MSLAYYDRVDRYRACRRGNGALWSEAEIKRLRVLYPRAEWVNLQKALPGRSKRAIGQKGSKLNIARLANRKPAWTGAEDKILRRLFSVASWDDLRRTLPRHTTKGIAQRGQTILKLSRPSRSKLRSRYELIRDLREVRRRSGELQSDLAERIGVHKSRIGFWELGVSVPRLPALLNWVQALGLKLTLTSGDKP